MDLRPLSFSVRIGAEVSDAEWAAVSALFSSEYGFYSAAAPDRAGERIRLGTQEPDDFSAYRTLIDSSAEVVRDAYGRMPQNEQAWATKTEDEIDAILEAIPGLSKNACIVDFGAGSGRHVAELRKRGFGAVTGVDFSAKESELVQSGDCRSWRSGRPVDLALCLYDVVGSFPDDKDNEAIVVNVAANLADGGYALFSVSNWDFVDRREVRKIDFDDMDSAVREIFALEPSATMRTDGEFFDSRYILVDEKRHLVCHKEQFPAGAGLPPGEFLIRDRRFTADEISNWLRAAGLEVLQRRFVRAGFKVDYAVSTGKEILILARKVSS